MVIGFPVLMTFWDFSCLTTACDSDSKCEPWAKCCRIHFVLQQYHSSSLNQNHSSSSFPSTQASYLSTTCTPSQPPTFHTTPLLLFSHTVSSLPFFLSSFLSLSPTFIPSNTPPLPIPIPPSNVAFLSPSFLPSLLFHHHICIPSAHQSVRPSFA